MILHDLITKLESVDPNLRVPMGFARPHSYRGDYSCLAFEPEPNITVEKMLACAKEALGKTYQGYKGGDFKMEGFADCYLAEYGCCGESIGPVFLGYMLGEYNYE